MTLSQVDDFDRAAVQGTALRTTLLDLCSELDSTPRWRILRRFGLAVAARVAGDLYADHINYQHEALAAVREGMRGSRS